MLSVVLLAVSLMATVDAGSEVFIRGGSIKVNDSYISMIENIENVGPCSLKCLDNSRCNGFLYNQQQRVCRLYQCFNPLKQQNSSDQSFIRSSLRIQKRLARGKPASASTTHGGSQGYTFEPGKAVDGTYLPKQMHEYSSIFHSTEETNPWWRVDLQGQACVTAVNILNRAAVNYLSLQNAVVTVSNDAASIFSSSSFCGKWAGVLSRYFTYINCSPVVSGSLVQIQLIPGTSMQIYEVEVHGYN